MSLTVYKSKAVDQLELCIMNLELAQSALEQASISNGDPDSPHPEIRSLIEDARLIGQHIINLKNKINVQKD